MFQMLLGVAKKNAGYLMIDHIDYVNVQKYNMMANIETSNRCPLRCPQCTRAKLLEPKDTAQYKEIKSRIDNGDDLSIKDAEKLLNFFEGGLMLCGQLSDPVYWKHFMDFLKLRNKKYSDSFLRIHTSASQKNLQWYKKAFELCNDKVVWVFGVDGLTTSEIYRVGQNSKIMFDAMLLAKSMNIKVEWHYIVFKHNVHELEEARKFAKTHDISFHHIKTNRSGGGVEAPDNYKPKRNKEIANDFV